MSDLIPYLETIRMVEESKCKHYKRLIVGFIRYFQNDEGEVIIPESFFDDVPDDLGFSHEFIDAEVEDDQIVESRALYLSSWDTKTQDCGGESQHIDDVTFYIPKDNVVHLKIVSNKQEDTI